MINIILSHFVNSIVILFINWILTFFVAILSAIQYHSGWAYSENVNVLSAGYNKPEFGSIGSGIYLGIDISYFSFLP